MLAIHRVIQRWNQTGQKFAGAPDIVQDVLKLNPIWLWILVTATYLTLLYRIGNHIVHDIKTGAALGTACSLVLVVPAFLFKLGFTANDAPELLSWLGDDTVGFLERIPLVGSARVVFLTLASETIWTFSAAANADMPKAAKARKHCLNNRISELLHANIVTLDRPSTNCHVSSHPLPRHPGSNNQHPTLSLLPHPT